VRKLEKKLLAILPESRDEAYERLDAELEAARHRNNPLLSLTPTVTELSASSY
jgi:hypothetical protein